MYLRFDQSVAQESVKFVEALKISKVALEADVTELKKLRDDFEVDLETDVKKLKKLRDGFVNQD